MRKLDPFFWQLLRYGPDRKDRPLRLVVRDGSRDAVPNQYLSLLSNLILWHQVGSKDGARLVKSIYTSGKHPLNCY